MKATAVKTAVAFILITYKYHSQGHEIRGITPLIFAFEKRLRNFSHSDIIFVERYYISVTILLGGEVLSKPKNSSDTTGSTQDNEKIISQYRHIKELSQLKYDAEERREQNLIQQSSQMQTAFSFMTAAIFMAVPICIEYRGTLSLGFFLLAVSVMVAFLIASLVLASIAQWRWKTESLPDVEDIKNEVLNSPEWEKLTIEYNQIDQWVDVVGKVQAKKAELNDRRVKLIIASMICFYFSILSLVISFIVGIAKII